MTSDRRGRTRNQGPPVVIELALDSAANGGASVGRDETGRAVFCEGGLPGEIVRVELHTQKKRFARGRVIEVVEASQGRVAPQCPTHTVGCGGCDLAHATTELQSEMKRRVVADALVRIGRIDAGDVEAMLAARVPESDVVLALGYRTTVRAAIKDGRAGYRKRGSHDVVAASTCRVAHPRIEELLADGRFDDSAGGEVVLRASVSTGQRLAVVDGDTRGVHLPDDVVVVSHDQLAAGAELSITEHAAGRDWQVSAGSFFQAGPEVASSLVAAVARATGSTKGSTVVDAYAGIGLFGGTVGAEAEELVSVERSGSSSTDARTNLADLPATIVECAVEEWSGLPADLVIADPSRAGLGPEGVSSLMRCSANRFVLVSCDTGSLGRDVGLLLGEGYQATSVQIVDAFPDTSHVETVVGFVR